MLFVVLSLLMRFLLGCNVEEPNTLYTIRRLEGLFIHGLFLDCLTARNLTMLHLKLLTVFLMNSMLPSPVMFHFKKLYHKMHLLRTLLFTLVMCTFERPTFKHMGIPTAMELCVPSARSIAHTVGVEPTRSRTAKRARIGLSRD